jgi:hypothetical protein
MSNNDSVPGMLLPTQKGMPAGNPRDSALQSMNNNAQLQAQANAALSGGRHRKRKSYGGGDVIPVPQYQMLYESQGGPGTNPNNQIQASSQTSTQMAANSALDSGATKIGGNRKRRSRKGGNPDWLWGCMSGGKKRTIKATRKRRTKKSRKNRRSRKH